MAEYTIWTFNSATQLIAGYENSLIDKFGYDKVTFGDRPVFSEDQDNIPDIEPGSAVVSPFWRHWNHESYTHQLMNENSKAGPGSDEYFVPIPLKCLGRLATKQGLTDANIPIDYLNSKSAKDIYDSIIKCPDNSYFPGNSVQTNVKYEDYWKAGHGYGPYNKIRMNTKEHKGYYEILCNWRGYGVGAAMFPQNPNYGCKNILIGYSQGGLVARYLAFLDEYIFGGLAGIAGVITVGTPNYGSPLANNTNADSVIRSLWVMCATLLGLNEQLFPTLHKLLFKEVTSKFTLDTLNAIDKDILDRYTLSKINRKSDVGDEFVTTFIKWLSGLNGVAYSAFLNLNAESHARTGSVYNLLNVQYPHKKIKTAAIVNANSDLKRLLNDFMPWWMDLLANIFSKNELFQTPLKESYVKASEVYKKKLMLEVGESIKRHPVTLKKYNEYINGTSDFRLASWAPRCTIIPYTHDFVVPSVNELLDDSIGGDFLGNVVNVRSNHLSGNSRRYRGGYDNYHHIEKFLGEMLK